MKRLIFFTLCVLLITTSSAYGAFSLTAQPVSGTSTDEYIQDVGVAGSDVYRVLTWTWASTAGTDTGSGGYVYHVTGEVVSLQAIPSDSDAPDVGYDITIRDENDMDILAGYGANLSTEDSIATNRRGIIDTTVSRPQILTDDTLYFRIDQMGTSTGTAKLKIRVRTGGK